MSKQVQYIPDAPALSDFDFETFRDFFYRHTGMFFQDSKRYFVDKRLLSRMEATRSSSVREYLAKVRLQPSGSEMQALINTLTVNETYFFRDLAQIECLTYRIIPEIVANKKDETKLRIWSSPCSSGEEPLSIALHLLEYWPQVDDYEIEIFGTDIDTEIIEQARSGIFSQRSVQNLPQQILRQYFTLLKDGCYRISAELTDSIDFQQVNIMNASQTRCYRDFDIVFSRNMLIYFDDQSRRIAVEAFYDALRPDGFICLAPTESMSRISSLFKLRTYPGVTAYQKKL